MTLLLMIVEAILLSGLFALIFTLRERRIQEKIDQIRWSIYDTKNKIFDAPHTELQEMIRAWHLRNYPNEDASLALISVVEELGEVSRAHSKQAGGIRGTWKYWQTEKEKEAGDVIIGLINYLSHCDINFETALRNRWATISQRDYIQNPLTGGREKEQQQ